MSTDTQPTERPYVYFVSFSYGHGVSGFGNCELPLPGPVTSIHDVKAMGATIAEAHRLPTGSVVVLCWGLLRGPGKSSGGDAA